MANGPPNDQTQITVPGVVLDSPEDSDVLSQRPLITELVGIVIPLVAFKWEDIATNLELHANAIAGIKASDRLPNEGHCKEMLNEWLRTTGAEQGSNMGSEPRTWKSVIKAIYDSIGSEVANEVEKELFPNPSPKELGGMPDIEQLQCHVIPQVAAKWHDFGLFLGIHEAKLDALAEPDNQHDVQVWCKKAFKLWLQGNTDSSKPRTWKTLLEAVTGAVGEGVTKEIMEQLKGKYTKDSEMEIN